MTLSEQLADQLDWHWQYALRPRLAGLNDDEYFWEPAPEPAPFTTIAWRLAHIVVGVLAMRTHSHFGGPSADYQSWPYATDADTALTQLDDAYRGWHDGVLTLSDRDLGNPVGPAEGPWADRPMTDLILHINRAVIHHGAEIACIRDLYAHRQED